MSPFSRFAHYFIAVARCGSLRRAAEQLHISASAINRQILQAEEAFGTPLFERLPDVLDEVQRGQLAFVPLRSTLLRPLTLALCTAPSRQLSRPAQMAIQTLSAVIESMATVSPAAR
ncbi:LysR family transcriptional regulator [Klebsiella pneumoniae]|uniref:LysR family transcriptional regulator n=1 Tax=Klebsiella pneumoniae TaxID=573 RepID=UPI0015D60D33|nr:LysR family transcriptional regulator [Klebsiella pneumoniae]